MSRLLQEQRRPLRPPVLTTRTGTLCLHAEIPEYSGYANRKSVADFLDELREYLAVSDMTEVELVSRILSIALTGSAATWHRRQPPFLTLHDLSEQFKSEFLPPDYGARMLDDLRARTEHRDESLVEFVLALQTLYDGVNRSASDAHKVSRAIRQSHPQFHPYLRGREFRSSDELAQEAHQIQISASSTAGGLPGTVLRLNRHEQTICGLAWVTSTSPREGYPDRWTPKSTLRTTNTKPHPESDTQLLPQLRTIAFGAKVSATFAGSVPGGFPRARETR
ncbi:hypothetical protein HPB47_002650 [Ixodes persulcatus]|uniref:Uncharacterized protein n=1 Tax=Ixodes persulcatus TaxID=34615 RepID=A0AC60PLR9_IXOPE|nr:hypothetical protein HPB47_002650 [Ixodes persulcatus]